MLFNLIIGAIAGYGAYVSQWLLGAQINKLYKMETQDLQVFAFVLAMLLAIILLGIGGVDPKPFALLLGGGFGVLFHYWWKLGKEIYHRYHNAHNDDTTAPSDDAPQRKKQKKPSTASKAD